MTSTKQNAKPSIAHIETLHYESKSFHWSIGQVIDQNRVEIWKETWPEGVPIYGGRSYEIRKHWVNGVLSNVSSSPWVVN